MAFVQVKNLLQTLKIAAFTVAFFSSFFSHALTIVELVQQDLIATKSPKVNDTVGYCFQRSGCTVFYNSVDESIEAWKSLNPPGGGAEYVLNQIVLRNVACNPIDGCSTHYGTVYLKQYAISNGSYVRSNTFDLFSYDTQTKSCPPDTAPSFVIPVDINSVGEPTHCVNPADYQYYLDGENELKKNDDYCKTLVLDSGNNTAQDMCYSAGNGAACNLTQVSVGDATYYEGTGNEALGCGGSDKPPYDLAGTGDDKDNCMYSDGINYCEADRAKHCKNIQGSEICDEGCIDNGSKVFCDVREHADVGEGESKYLDDKGTCSIVSASASKGFCEDQGGSWDDAEDYKDAVCPVGGGTCSVPTAGLCQACFDAGGVWTPDGLPPTSPEEQASVEIAALIKQGNTKLTAIEAGARKTGESIISTIKSGNGKVVSAIDALTKITKDKATGAAAAKEEKETFTTTTGDVDKTAFNTLFDAASTAALKVENTAKELEIKNLMHSFINEGKSLFTITASGSGYEAKNLVMSSGTYDSSMGRFGFFFVLLAAPIMLAATVKSAQIILGKNS